MLHYSPSIILIASIIIKRMKSNRTCFRLHFTWARLYTQTDTQTYTLHEQKAISRNRACVCGWRVPQFKIILTMALCNQYFLLNIFVTVIRNMIEINSLNFLVRNCSSQVNLYW